MRHEFYRRILENGMTVFLEKRHIPVVAVAFALRNGGINEIISEKGISHFIEHMLYKGTPTRNAKQIAEEIEKKGAPKNLTDTAILNFLTSRIDKEIETVRGYFHGSRFRVFAESKIFEITHVTICVKKHDNIINFRLL